MPQDPHLMEHLKDLAMNLSWTWQSETSELFRKIDAKLWETKDRNPVAFLQAIEASAVARRCKEDPLLHAQVLYAHRRLKDYLACEGPLGGRRARALSAAPVAYFSAEFGIHECLPIYSGGLGILAGDHLKAASDMGVPLTGVGILYANGYFHQRIDPQGRQQERYEDHPGSGLPITPALTPQGKAIRFTLPFPGRKLHVKAWLAQVGRVRLYLMDTDVKENAPEDRALTDRLYSGNEEKRIKQEMVLGLGGLRTLRLAGLRPRVLHLNEGHCGFAVLERTRERMEEDGLDFQKAWTQTLRQTCFTTHTPVPAGHDRFDAELMERYLGWLRKKIGLSTSEFMALGRVNAGDEREPFCMTVLCIKGSQRRNGVSNLHGQVSRDMWKDLWPNRTPEEVPIGHITNGVHRPTWQAPDIRRLLDKRSGGAEAGHPDPLSDAADADIDADELWETHLLLKGRLVHQVREALLRQAAARKEARPKVEGILDPAALTIGFSRRFATYKRATLLFDDMRRFRSLVLNPKAPVQFIFAGKAHPKDEPGKRLIQQVFALTRDPRLKERLVFVEDYDIGVARHLVQGIDVWLNNPERPLEACGTSGMKVALNGGLNCSILDGWWDEAYDGMNGFAIGDGIIHADGAAQRKRDVRDLYAVLERQVVPCYYRRDRNGLPAAWVARMRRAIQSLEWRYSAERMVGDYFDACYLPTAGATILDMC